MKCQKCQKEFSTKIKLNGKTRNLQRRKYCLDCSPFGEHNTIDLTNRPTEALCVCCKGGLKFKQIKYCSSSCKAQHTNSVNSSSYKCQQGRALQRKITFVNQLGGKCEKCGYAKNLAALTFHHRDPALKVRALDARGFSNTNLTTLTEEVKKCTLLCHNCHTELHHPYLNLDLLVQVPCSDH